MTVPRKTKPIWWSTPSDVKAAAAGMSFVEYLTAVTQGQLPNSPAIELLGMRLKSIGNGTSEISFIPEEYHVNFVGAVHGGIISAVLDSCIGYAVNTTLKADETFVTAQLNVQFIRGIRADGETFRARASLQHRGGRITVAEALLENASSALCATATATCLIMKRAAA